MYILSSEHGDNMIPSFYNGTKVEGNFTKDVKDINLNKIRIAAVTCRFGYMDSKV
jgi:hypothetical protein